jgi:hypothetical protein
MRNRNGENVLIYINIHPRMDILISHANEKSKR